MEDALSVHCVLFTFTSPHRRLQTEYPGFSGCWLLSGHGSGLGGCTEKAEKYQEFGTQNTYLEVAISWCLGKTMKR